MQSLFDWAWPQSKCSKEIFTFDWCAPHLALNSDFEKWTMIFASNGLNALHETAPRRFKSSPSHGDLEIFGDDAKHHLNPYSPFWFAFRAALGRDWKMGPGQSGMKPLFMRMSSGLNCSRIVGALQKWAPKQQQLLKTVTHMKSPPPLNHFHKMSGPRRCT